MQGNFISDHPFATFGTLAAAMYFAGGAALGAFFPGTMFDGHTVSVNGKCTAVQGAMPDKYASPAQFYADHPELLKTPAGPNPTIGEC